MIAGRGQPDPRQSEAQGEAAAKSPAARLASGHRKPPHGLCARLQQHAGALIERRTRRKHIIDEKQVFSLHRRIPANFEGVLQVLHAAAPIEMRLRDSVAKTLKSLTKGQPTFSRQLATEDFSLVELALAFSQGVQRHGDHSVKGTAPQSGVAKPLGKEIAQERTKPDLAPVLEPVDEVAHNPAGLHDRHRANEMEGSATAIRANEGIQQA